MGMHYNRKCSVCGRQLDQDQLVVKKVQFKDLGKNGRTRKSRNVAWLCNLIQSDGSPSCLSKDEDWQRPMYASSPGMVDTEIALDV